MDELFDDWLFTYHLPQLLKHKKYYFELKSMLDKESQKLLSKIILNETESDDEIGPIYDAAFETYYNLSNTVFTLSWDGQAPGNSGACSVYEYAGIYVVSSSDYPVQGPFDSLSEALGCECFSLAINHAQISCKVLSLKELKNIAKPMVDWDKGGEIVINSRLYIFNGKQFTKHKKLQA